MRFINCSRACTAVVLHTSQGCTHTVEGYSLRMASNRVVRLAISPTAQPSAIRHLATSKPIPDEAPTTIAFFIRAKLIKIDVLKEKK